MNKCNNLLSKHSHLTPSVRQRRRTLTWLGSKYNNYAALNLLNFIFSVFSDISSHYWEEQTFKQTQLFMKLLLERSVYCLSHLFIFYSTNLSIMLPIFNIYNSRIWKLLDLFVPNGWMSRLLTWRPSLRLFLVIGTDSHV